MPVGNYSNLTPFNLTPEMLANFSGNLLTPCARGLAYSPECIYKTFCPQFSSYFINMGITVIAIYILGTWLTWAFFRYLRPIIDWDSIYAESPWLAQVCDMRLNEDRLDANEFIRDKLSKLLLGYAVVVVYLSVAQG